MERGAWHSKQCLSLEDVIRGYTIGAAEAGGWQNEIGSLYPGKLADLIILDRDLFQIVESDLWGNEIAETKVMMTIFDGQVVFDAR
jgi:predicted amidohydrolase YtcJ